MKQRKGWKAGDLCSGNVWQLLLFSCRCSTGLPRFPLWQDNEELLFWSSLIISSAFLPNPGFWISHFVLSANTQFPMGSGAFLWIQTSGSPGVTQFPLCCSLGECCCSQFVPAGVVGFVLCRKSSTESTPVHTAYSLHRFCFCWVQNWLGWNCVWFLKNFFCPSKNQLFQESKYTIFRRHFFNALILQLFESDDLQSHSGTANVDKVPSLQALAICI